MNAADSQGEILSADQAWREMRLYMEWNEALSLCFLFAPDTRAVASIRQWASDSFAYRTAPLLVVEPQNPVDAAATVLESLQHQVSQFGMVRAPVWVQLTAIDDTTQTGWETTRAELLSRLNEAREWLVKSFARPLVLCLPPAWRNKVVAVAPDLWHIRSYSAQLPPAAGIGPGRILAIADNQSLQSVVQRQLAAGQPELELTRARLANRPGNHALQRDLSLALDGWGDTNMVVGRTSEALAAYRESLDICRQLRQALGDSPQVLRDLSVSLNKVGGAEDAAGRSSEALAAYRESLEIFRQLRQALGDSPQVLDDLAVALERMAQLGAQDRNLQMAAIDEALALRQRLVAVTKHAPYHLKRLTTAQSLAQRLSLGVKDLAPNPSAATTTGPAARSAPAPRS